MTVTEIARVIASTASTQYRAQPPADWKRDVIANIRVHAPLQAPECDVSLPDNTRLRAMCTAARRGDDVTREDREDMALAGAHANTLREHATREAAKLDALFGAWREFAASESATENECAVLIDRFLRAAWRLELKEPPTLGEGRRLATRITNAAIRGHLPDMGYF